MRKMAKDAKTVAEKWNRRLKGAIEDIRVGVEATTKNPAEEARKKKGKWVARMTAKETHDKWDNALSKVTLDDWKNAMINKGLGRISAGADEAVSDVEEFMSELLPHIDEGKRKIEKMPDITLEDNIRRMEEFIRHMAKFKRRK